MKKKIAILQSNYIPWKGYFDIINMVDEFIIYDVVQYTKNDWRNRNKIKTPNGLQWLTIPVKHDTSNQTIMETQISRTDWGKKHWNTLKTYYGKSKYFKNYAELFQALFRNDEPFLSKINLSFIQLINKILGINTKISSCLEYELVDGRSKRLVNLCLQANADTYISGPAAKNYLDMSEFDKANISVEWVDYSGYKQYNQMHPPFEHHVSIIDLIFNEGPNAVEYMKSFNM